MYKIILTYIIIFSFSPLALISQTKEKVNLNEGLGFYKSGSYQTARKKFDQAYKENPRYTKALYNAGNAAYLNGSFDTAITYYSDYAKQIKSDHEIAKAHFNIGNSHLQKAQIAETNKEKLKDAQAFYKEAIQAYKTSLKYEPNDPETKYNLTYALNKLQKNQQQEQQQNKDQKKDDQEKDDQEKKDNQDQSDKKEGDNGDQGDPKDDKKDPKDPKDGGENGDESNDKKDSKNQEGNKPDNKEGEEEKDKQQNGKPGDPNNEEPVEGQISRAQAIKDLDAINNEEGKVLQKVYQKKGDKKEKKNSEKDW